MANAERSIDAELIRYRIEKRMAGRRDLLLHALVYIGVAVLFVLNSFGLEAMEYFFLGGLWTIPLALHGLRYFYRSGPGAVKRADEIERALDEQLERTALDEDEELLIEERVSKRILARRILAAHGLASGMYLAIYPSYIASMSFGFVDYPDYYMRLIAFCAAAFGLHAVRFFFVHGRSPGGRALKIDAELEREWHRSRERGRARRQLYEVRTEADGLELSKFRGARMRLNDEGELAEIVEEVTAESAGQGRAT